VGSQENGAAGYILGAGSEEPLVDELIEDAVGMAADGGGDGGDGMEEDFGEPDDVRARPGILGYYSVWYDDSNTPTQEHMAAGAGSTVVG